MGSFRPRYSRLACIKGIACSKTQRQFDRSFLLSSISIVKGGISAGWPGCDAAGSSLELQLQVLVVPVIYGLQCAEKEMSMESVQGALSVHTQTRSVQLKEK